MNEQEQVDPTALALSRSIRKAEGGDYENTSGDNNTSAGAYQFNNGKSPLKKGDVPANFKSFAKEVNLNPEDFSQTNQDHVMYERILRKLKNGQSQSSIAAEHNSGLTHGWESHKGSTTINGKTINYDTPGYVNKVKKYYEEEMNGVGQANNSQDTSTYIPEQPDTEKQQEEPGIMEQLGRGNIGGAIMKGVNNVTSPFAGLAALPVQAGVKAYNFLTGKSEAEKVKDPFSKEGGNTSGLGVTPLTAKDKGLDFLKAGATTAAVAGGGLLGNALSGAGALTNPVIIESLPGKITQQAFLKMGKTEKLNLLGDILKTANNSGRLGDAIEVGKAIKYLNPEAGWIKRLLKSSYGLAKNVALTKLLGDTAGGLIHKATE